MYMVVGEDGEVAVYTGPANISLGIRRPLVCLSMAGCGRKYFESLLVDISYGAGV